MEFKAKCMHCNTRVVFEEDMTDPDDGEVRRGVIDCPGCNAPLVTEVHVELRAYLRAVDAIGALGAVALIPGKDPDNDEHKP